MARSLSLFEAPTPVSVEERRDVDPGTARRAETPLPEAPGSEPARADARRSLQAPAGAQPSEARSKDAPLDRFAVLLGRAPTDAEKLELVRVKEAMDLDNNDALWLRIMGLDHLRGRFEASIDGQRRQFEASIDRRLAAVEVATGHVVESAKAQFLRDFPAALKQVARKGVVKALGFNGPVAGMALVVASLGVVGVGWLAYDLGKSAGYEQGVLAHKAATPPAPKPPAPPSAKGR